MDASGRVNIEVLRRSTSTSCGGYPPPDLKRRGTADLADLFIGDLYDANEQTAKLWSSGARVQALAALPRFWDFGGRAGFSGQVQTVQCFENNLMIRASLSEPGEGQVLVVDCGASSNAAVFGDNLAALVVKNGWTGVLINGFIRDVACLSVMPLGVKALGVYPIKSGKREWGVRNVSVRFGGVRFCTGDWIFCDEDGVLVSDRDLQAVAAAQASER